MAVPCPPAAFALWFVEVQSAGAAHPRSFRQQPKVASLRILSLAVAIGVEEGLDGEQRKSVMKLKAVYILSLDNVASIPGSSLPEGSGTLLLL